MTSARDELDASELRQDLEYWHGQVCLYAREYRSARQSGDFAWEAGIGVALDQALGQVRRLEALLRLGVAA